MLTYYLSKGRYQTHFLPSCILHTQMCKYTLIINVLHNLGQFLGWCTMYTSNRIGTCWMKYKFSQPTAQGTPAMSCFSSFPLSAVQILPFPTYILRWQSVRNVT